MSLPCVTYPPFQERVRTAAEQRSNQLLAKEESAKQRVAQLTEELSHNRRELSVVAKQIRLAEAAARKKVGDIALLQFKEQYELDKMDEQLQEVRTDAYVADQLVEKLSQEEMDSEMREWEKDMAKYELKWVTRLHEKAAVTESSESSD